VGSERQASRDGVLADEAPALKRWSIGNPMIRLFHLYVPSSLMVLFLVDVALLYSSISLGFIYSYASVSDLLSENTNPSLVVQRVLFVVVVMLSLFTMGLHHRRYIAVLRMVPLRLAASHLMAFVILTLVFYVVPGTRIWLSAFLPALGISFVSLLICRVVFVRAAKVSLFRHPVLILGAGVQAQQIEMAEGGGRIRCVGFVAPDNTDIKVSPQRVIAGRNSLADIATRYGAAEIVIGLEERRGRLPTNELLDCRLKGLWVSDFSSFMERETGQVELQSLDPSWLIFSDGFSAAHRIERMIKRLFDICASTILLTFAMPVAVMAALAIRLEDGGPIFYRQQRVGLHGQPFMLLKFRSMSVNAESDGVARWAAVDDQRVTRVGAIIRKTRVDEIPQVINVLKGEMSFVGPRPERPTIVDDLSQGIPYYQYRHVVKPGITGWAQISYPYGASIEDAYQKLKFDLYYIKNYSLVLDFLILIQTIRVVLWPQGAR
jgi:sugar transferase (PEP-CTERM system associated)